MRLWIFSDLHLEFLEPAHPPAIPDADVCVVAGDILDCGIVPSIRWLGENIAMHMPVVFVAGNHEFYRSFFRDAMLAAAAETRKYSNVFFLENREVIINDVVFIGATMWTDFDLYGTPELSARHARRAMADYKAIRFEKTPFRYFSPMDSAKMHRQSRRFILDRLETHAGRRRIVVTHHAPSAQSIPERFLNDSLSPAFASDLESEIIRTGPDIWIHGHVHEPCSYVVGRTRVLCNPGGYPGENQLNRFSWAHVITV